MFPNSDQQILVSIALFLFSLILFRRASIQGVPTLLKWFMVFLVLLFGCLSIAYLVADYFTNQGIDESVVFHLKLGLKGAGFSEYTLLIVTASLGLAIVMMMGWLITHWSEQSGQEATIGFTWVAALVAILALIVNPVTANIRKLTVRPPSTDLVFDDYYLTVEDVAIKEKRNILFIYLEGLEATYMDASQFPGLTPNLSSLSQKGTFFSDIRQVPGTEATITGMIASQCGLPSFFPSSANSMFGIDKVLPAETCLGDILSAAGYNLEFIGGASLEFAGKGKFLKSHGFKTVLGRSELAQQLPYRAPTHGWGMYDEDLLKIVQLRLEELYKSNQPFVLMTLTLDTHHPTGHVSKGCLPNFYGDGQNDILNAVHCTDRLVGSFLKETLDSTYGDDLLVVLASDHLAMRNTAFDQLQALPRRRFFLVIDGRDDSPEKVDNPGTSLDIAPTVLDYLDIDIGIGLGRNLMQRESISADYEKFSHVLKAWYQELSDLWHFPSLVKGISIFPDERTAMINGRKFKTPFLMQFGPSLETRMFFGSDPADKERHLRRNYQDLELGSGFVWVDECQRMRKSLRQQEMALCILFGRKGHGDLVLEGVSTNFSLSQERIRKLFD